LWAVPKAEAVDEEAAEPMLAEERPHLAGLRLAKKLDLALVNLERLVGVAVLLLLPELNREKGSGELLLLLEAMLFGVPVRLLLELLGEFPAKAFTEINFVMHLFE